MKWGGGGRGHCPGYRVPMVFSHIHLYKSYDISYDLLMPHISSKKLDKKIIDELEKHLLSIIRDSGTKTRVLIFEELLTKTEKAMLAKRIGILFLLKKGLSPYKISELLGVSPSTAERFERAMDSRLYRHSVDWVWKNSREGAFDKFLESLVALAFTGRTKSFKKFLDEY